MDSLNLEEVFARVNNFLNENCLNSSWNARKDDVLEIVIIHRSSSGAPFPRQCLLQTGVKIEEEKEEEEEDLGDIELARINCHVGEKDALPSLSTRSTLSEDGKHDNLFKKILSSDNSSDLDSFPSVNSSLSIECFDDGEDVKVFGGTQDSYFDDVNNDVLDDDRDISGILNAWKRALTRGGTLTRNGRVSVPTVPPAKRKRRKAQSMRKREYPSSKEELEDPSCTEADPRGNKAKLRTKMTSTAAKIKENQVMKTLGKNARGTKQYTEERDEALVDGQEEADCIDLEEEAVESEEAGNVAEERTNGENDSNEAKTTSEDAGEQKTNKRRPPIRKPKLKRGGGRPPIFPELKRGINGLIKCPLCEATYEATSPALKHYRKAHKKSLYPCTHCPREFYDPTALGIHEDKLHNDGTGQYVCQECGMRFHHCAGVEYHVKQFHNVSARVDAQVQKCKLKCTVVGCGATFDRIGERQAHLFAAHQDQIKYCPVCKRPFTTEKHLFAHIKMTHDKAPFCKCKFCDKEFALEESLSYHYDEEHEDEDVGPRNFLCTEPVCLKR